MIRKLVFSALFLVLAGSLAGAVFVFFYARQLDGLVVEKFSGKRWDIPSKIFADSILLYPGIDIDAIGLPARVERLRYRETRGTLDYPGEYHRTNDAFELYVREFAAASGRQPARAIRLDLRKGTVARITDVQTGEEITSVELEPEVLAGLYQSVWEERRVLTLDKVPSTLVNAILSTEDQRFFEHHGVDPRGILRAFWVNLTSGRVVQGGSTLTQQLMKNFFLSEERSMSRKLREALMAVVAERHYSKREILENYLNEIYLGQNGAQGIFGVWEASRFHFRKDPSALTLPECALIAGLLTGPSYYSPLRHPERALQRRNNVLRLMFDRGLISQGELDEALAAPLGVAPVQPGSTNVRAPYFIDYLRQELAATYPADVLASEGLSIFTGLDPQMQLAAETAVERGIADLEKRYPRFAKGEQRLQACLIAIHPQTGEVKAMVGGREYGESQFNRCVQALRQPGSVFKPFTYVAALDHDAGVGGVTPATTLDDEPFTWTYEGRAWSPANYNDDYRGTVSVRQALENSLNAATTRLAQQVGLEKIRDTAQRMGIRSTLPLYPSLVLGAAEVTPMEVAQAYAVLANQGLRATALAVTAVVGPSGQVIERKPIEVERAISPEVAYLVTHLMEGVVDRGTGAGARNRGFRRHAAGKTGTTNEGRDAWFAGFTPDLLAVVWVGFDDNRNLGLSGAQAALPIWTEFMKQATAAEPDAPFLPPPGVIVVAIDPLTGGLATPACPNRIEEAFLDGDQPTDPCPLHDRTASPRMDHSDTESHREL